MGRAAEKEFKEKEGMRIPSRRTSLEGIHEMGSASLSRLLRAQRGTQDQSPETLGFTATPELLGQKRRAKNRSAGTRSLKQRRGGISRKNLCIRTLSSTTEEAGESLPREKRMRAVLGGEGLAQKKITIL